jgi:hypothetical protein
MFIDDSKERTASIFRDKKFATQAKSKRNREIDVIRSSETSVNFYLTTRRHIPENNTLHGGTARTSKPAILK